MIEKKAALASAWTRWLQAGKAWSGRPAARQFLLAAAVVGILVATTAGNFVPQRVRLHEGEVANADVVAPQTVVDPVRTEAMVRQAENQAVNALQQDPGNYVIDQMVSVQAGQQLSSAFVALKPLAGKPHTEQELEAASRTVAEKSGLELDAALLQALAELTPAQLEQAQNLAVSQVQDFLLSQRVESANLAQAAHVLQGKMAIPGMPARLLPLVQALVPQVVRPNLTLDPDKVRLARAQARVTTPPARILQGQVIIRRGEVVTADQVRLLQLLGLQHQQTDFLVVAGMILLVAGLVAILALYIHRYLPEVMRSQKMQVLVGLLLVLVVLIGKLIVSWPWRDGGLVIPAAFGSILVAILVDARLAVLASLIISMLLGMVAGGNYSVMFVSLAGGVVGVYSVSRVGQRSDLMRAGLMIGIVQTAAIFGLGLIFRDSHYLQVSYLGILSGLVSSVLAIGLLPYLESGFDITSSIRLLELANPSQPLLRRLLLEAPGTYHHSIMVGNLAEAAAEAVHADPLLVRVGAYYHDIGKMRRPYFFVENQMRGQNPHDRLSPSLSTLIIIAHVKDGLEMATQARLPAAVKAFIPEHHGTDLVRYFYHRAAEHDPGVAQYEESFRYPGPKPQSKATAILMLADGVEASVRALDKPTPGKIEATVRKIVRDRLNAGQLDEADITLRDLELISQAFVRVLTGAFHARIEYPEALVRQVGGEQKASNG
ncbi:MAG: HDIG domain-containing protein [Firmicutes bacterium]|nr:HDIG domain-containing protein [Bacillota bacterium]